MKNLVRGGFILSLLGMFVAVMYAQTLTENALSIANDSQEKLNISTIENKLSIEDQTVETISNEGQDKNKGQDDKNKVEKTVSTRATGGVSRGMFTATAYCLKGRTALGHGVRRGIIAADPRVLPLGSRINIGGGYSGTYLVSDTGGKVKGKRLDIWMPSCSEARRFGRRSVSVDYLGK
jgi:3D (Asp-Asp-Asp) domain-containing protein